MRVEKRDGSIEEVSFDKITTRIVSLCNDVKLKLLTEIDPQLVAQKVSSEIYDGVKTVELDLLSSEIAISLYTRNVEYKELASRIAISNHHKNTKNTFSEKIIDLYNYTKAGEPKQLINTELYNVVTMYRERIDTCIDYYRDYGFDYFGFKTLERSYLLKIDDKIVERPQDMFMRVALAIHIDNIELAFNTYDMMSNRYFIHATPTLFNAGSQLQQFSSCFLLTMESDSVVGIYNTLKDCAQISKYAGGIGLSIHDIRAKNSFIAGTNGKSNGIVPMLRVFNETARYIDQCVVPETIIYTSKGLKQIQHCDKETEIFTTNGLEIIENILEHSYTGEILKIETMHSIQNLKITPEHPVLCLKNQKSGTNYNAIINRLDHNLINNEYVDAKHLTSDDMLVFKIPEYEVDDVYITEDDCYLYGVMLGDGCMNNSSYSCYVSLDKTSKRHVSDWIETYLNKNCIKNYTTTKDNTVRIYWNRNTIIPFKYNDIYDENREKYIHHKWLNLPISKIQHIIKGLIDTDGCRHKELTFDNTSYKLIESFRYLLLRMGIPTSGYIRDRIGEKHETKYGDIIENKKISYTIRIPKTQIISDLLKIEKGKFFKYFVHKNYIYTRIKSIESDTFNGVLYDLQMKETHNYMIHNGIVHNGGGKRNGSFAIYIEPWHADIFDFLELKKNHGNELERARDLFYGLWIPDLFMECVQKDTEWCLFCPDKCHGLSDTYGSEFETLYRDYESREMYTRRVSAQKLWFSILTSQIETGTPYLLYKDACNRKSNQQNLGTIKSSNLCTEIVEYTSPEESAVCNLASISLPKFVIESDYTEHKLVIYSKPNCIYCIAAENFCKRHGIEYEKRSYNDITISPEQPVGVTFPKIYTSRNEFIGGYTELEKFFRPSYDFEGLKNTAKTLVVNLNNIIDRNYYPTEKTRRSNIRHRPIGIGVQGLANTFYKLRIGFDSPEARELNNKIFETIYYGSLEQSVEIAKKRQTIIETYKMMISDIKSEIYELEIINYKSKYNILDAEIERTEYLGTYSTYIGSPMYNGKLQFDLWNEKVDDSLNNWTELRKQICGFGVRNSLLVAPMPTASTSQIMGNFECFEPIISNVYTRRVLSGEHMVVNDYLVEDLNLFGLWNPDMKDKLIVDSGSIQSIPEIPDLLKQRYKTAWEIKQKCLIDMSVDRGKFICQSQSLNLFMEAPNFSKLSSMHFYGWKRGLKTGMYYLRTRPSSKAIQFTVSPEVCESCSA